MNFIIRKATINDVEDIIRLVSELASESSSESQIDTKATESFISSANCGILLAEADERVIGLLSYTIRPSLFHASSSCMVEELIIERQYRGNSIGKALFTKAMRIVEKNDCAEFSVTTGINNQIARQFYEANGLVVEALYMEKHY